MCIYIYICMYEYADFVLVKPAASTQINFSAASRVFHVRHGSTAVCLNSDNG